MVNEQIVEGLRLALSRGYTLEQAMMSFFNAGYKKEDIEEAARALSTHPEHPLSHPEKEIPEHLKRPITKSLPKKPEPVQVQSQASKEEKPEEEKTEEKKKISKYEEKTKPKGKLITILLIIFLFIIIATIVGIFIFKQELIDFFARL